MSLSCSCDFEHDSEPGQWQYIYYVEDLDFENLNTSKRKRCCSCNELININSLCVKYTRYRYPYNEVEAKIIHNDFALELDYPPEIKIADHYHCEKCGEIYLNLTNIGYECLAPCENMSESFKEYQALIGFKKNNSMKGTDK